MKKKKRNHRKWRLSKIEIIEEMKMKASRSRNIDYPRNEKKYRRRRNHRNENEISKAIFTKIIENNSIRNKSVSKPRKIDTAKRNREREKWNNFGMKVIINRNFEMKKWQSVIENRKSIEATHRKIFREMAHRRSYERREMNIKINRNNQRPTHVAIENNRNREIISTPAHQ